MMDLLFWVVVPGTLKSLGTFPNFLQPRLLRLPANRDVSPASINQS
jgi:hypothetical protein